MKIIAIVGPSGSGKTKLGDEILSPLGFSKFITDTTREMRINEIQDVSYHFKTVEEFKNSPHIEFVEYPKNSNIFYGLSVSEVVEKSKSKDCFAVLNIDGALALKKEFPETKIVFIYSPIEILEQRMRDRGDKEESIQERIRNISLMDEMHNDKYADFIIKNINFDEVKKEIISYIKTI